MFKKYLDIATVKRPSTTGTEFKKTWYSLTGAVVSGHLKPVAEEDVIEIDGFGKEFVFTCNRSADIIEHDLLTISGVDYTVKGVANTRGITFSTKRVLLNKS